MPLPLQLRKPEGFHRIHVGSECSHCLITQVVVMIRRAFYSFLLVLSKRKPVFSPLKLDFASRVSEELLEVFFDQILDKTLSFVWR